MGHTNRTIYTNRLPTHYVGCVPIQNCVITQSQAHERDQLRNTYTQQWVNSIDPAIAVIVNAYSSRQWRSEHDDTTPYYMTGMTRLNN